MTFATASTSNFIDGSVCADPEASRAVGELRRYSSAKSAEVIDLKRVFSRASTAGRGRGRDLRATWDERDGPHPETAWNRPLGEMGSHSDVESCRVDSLPAQPLHSCSAVDRFDSSSPHGIAVRGNQEKTR